MKKNEENLKKVNISSKTLSNWARVYNIDEKSIENKLEGILAEKFRSRRNKVLRDNYYLDTGYSQCNKTTEACKNLFALFIEYKKETIHIERKILLITSVVLLKKRGLIQCINKAIHNPEEVKDKVIRNLLLQFNVSFDCEDKKLIADTLNIYLPYKKGEDLLGMTYSSFKREGKKSEQGFYLTSKKVRGYLVEKVANKISKQNTILDPCCGTGAFLIEIYTAKKMQPKEIKNLFGVELDYMAALICKLNLILLQGRGYQVPNITHSDFFDLKWNSHFDLIIGNPPWGGKISQQFVKGDSFKAFLEEGLKILKEKGNLTFLLPKSYFLVSAHYNSRKKLIEHQTIDLLACLNNVFEKVMSQTILMSITNKYPHSFHRISTEYKEQRGKIPQRSFVQNNYTLNIFTSPQNFLLTKRIETNCIYLKNNVYYGMGIVTGNNKKFLSKDPNHGEGIISGKEVFKYYLEKPATFLDLSEKQNFQQVAPESLYRQEKLIYRFINKNLVFALDEKGLLTLNSVNFLIPKIKGYGIKFIMAVLNSMVAQLYFNHCFYSVKVLKYQIQAIPIPICTLKEQKPIEEMVELLSGSGDRHKMYREIEHEIRKLYKLSKTEDEIIDQQIKVKYLK
ncbi:TaqI-like C-terminal specificity domain-containing protein [Proteinivorax tanatarense]|uniref:site-specific DNA-methyltransferase (adenine-specific) n=1 Tax=Proteinivorax tanatarense TaxID=1260629 RepID=A0AAU7VLA0_9FIRM